MPGSSTSGAAPAGSRSAWPRADTGSPASTGRPVESGHVVAFPDARAVPVGHEDGELLVLARA